MPKIRPNRIAILLAVAVSILGTGTSEAAQATSASREDGAELLQSAAWAYEGGFYESAEAGLEDYIKRFPASRLVPRARLLQAQTRFHLGKLDAALKILEEHEPEPNEPLRDRFIYWRAEIAFKRGEYVRASNLYRQLITEAPSSALVLEASFSQALSEFRLKRYPEVIRLLQPRRGTFGSAADSDSDEEFALQGKLLLAETLLLQRQHEEADDVLEQLESRPLSAEQKWRTSLLRTKVQKVEGNLEAALDLLSGVMENARAAGDPAYVAESLILRAEILEALNRRTEAAETYEELLRDGSPGPPRRKAFLALINLHLNNGETDAAIGRMERFIQESPSDPFVPEVLTQAGELYKAQVERPDATPEERRTYLVRMRDNLGQLAETTPDPRTGALANTLVGWSFLKEGRLGDARAAYEKAEAKTEIGTLRAKATTGLAETDYREGDLAAALERFRTVLRTPSVIAESGILDHAKIESIRILVELGDTEQASPMLEELRSSTGGDAYVRGALLLAQGISRSGDPAAARALLGKVESDLPESAFIPEVRLKIAEAHMDGGEWVEAREALDQWVAEFPDHELLPDVEFDKAWATAMNGNESEALRLFENFLTRWESPKAAKAQFWIGNHHLANGEFTEAEAAFQQVYTKWPDTGLRDQARMMAGFAATQRQAYSDAQAYFKSIVEEFVRSQTSGGPTVPGDIAIDAFFAYADSFTLSVTDATKEESFENAIRTLDQLINEFTQRQKTFPQLSNALARKAECYRQINSYKEAIRDFREALSKQPTDPDLKAQVMIGLALSLEDNARQSAREAAEAMITEALTFVKNVYLGLPDGDGRPADAWMIKAGFELTRMLEQKGSLARAASVYEQMLERFPAMTGELTSRLKRVRSKMAGA